VRGMLNPAGALYVEVPGLKNPRVASRNNSAQPGHLLYFDLHTLTELIERSGFCMISGNETVQGVFRLICD
ncbi:MAG: hypothetical protein OEU95_04100, partial [Nitrospirota bacterium]|nr:hypothetical protein [Nitrospirota bacterium]